MQRVAFGPATVESGANKGKARTLSFKTGIKPENANGLTVVNGAVYIEVSAAIPQRIEFASADEVREYASGNFDAFVLSAANNLSTADVRARLTNATRKLTASPLDVPTWAKNESLAQTPEGLFVISEGGKSGTVKAEVTALAAKADSMSIDELRAAIAALAAK